MLKETIQNLGAGAAKTIGGAVKLVKPSELVRSAGTSMINNAIQQLGNRSPLLGDLSTGVMDRIVAAQKLNQVRSEKLDSFLKTPGAKKDNQTDKQIRDILDRIDKQVREQGMPSTQESDLFKKYETSWRDWDKFRTETEKSTKPKAESASTAKVGADSGLLNEIVENTSAALDILSSIRDRSGDAMATSQPATIKSALAGVGANLIKTIFNERVVEKMADLAANAAGMKETRDGPKPEAPKNGEAGKVQEDILEAIKDLKPSSEDISESSRKPTPDIQVAPKESLADIHKPKIKNQIPSISKVQTAPGDILRKAATKAGYTASSLPRSFNQTAVARAIGGLGATTGTIVPPAPVAAPAASKGILSGIGSAARMLSPFAAVAAAGAAGTAIGTGIAPLIDRGISAVSGRTTSLGGAIYDMFNSDPNSDPKSPHTTPKNKPLSGIVAAKKTSATMATVATGARDAAVATQKSTVQPIVLNNNSPAATPAKTGGTGVVVGSSVRNQESTFERVQMRDFWPRMV